MPLDCGIREHGVAVMPSATLRIQSPQLTNSDCDVRHVVLDAKNLMPSTVYELEIGCLPSGCKNVRTLRYVLRANPMGDCAHFCTTRLSAARMERLFGTRVYLRPSTRSLNTARDVQCALLGRTINTPPLHDQRVCSMMLLL